MKRYINLSMSPGNMAENKAGEWMKYLDHMVEVQKWRDRNDSQEAKIADLYTEMMAIREQKEENEKIINGLYLGTTEVDNK